MRNGVQLNELYAVSHFINTSFQSERVRCIDGSVRTASDFLWKRIHPCAPPAKSAVSYDLILTCCHELHIPKTVFRLVPIHEMNLVISKIQT